MPVTPVMSIRRSSVSVNAPNAPAWSIATYDRPLKAKVAATRCAPPPARASDAASALSAASSRLIAAPGPVAAAKTIGTKTWNRSSAQLTSVTNSTGPPALALSPSSAAVP